MSGMTGLAPLDVHTALGSWTLAPVADAIAALAALGYLWRVRSMRAHGVRWPIGRTIAFLAGLVVLLIAMQSSVEVYGHELFAMHMVQHLLLIMVVPMLVVLGQPLSLLYWDVDGGTDQGREDHLVVVCRAVLRSPVARALTYPGVGLGLYAAVLIGTHLTGFMQLMLQHMWLHDVEVVLYLLGGYLYFLPLLGHEPLAKPLSYPLRVFLMLMGMTVDTVVGVVLMMAAREPFPGYAEMGRAWGSTPLADVHTGGAIMWVVGDGLMMAIMIVAIAAWMSDTERQNDTGSWLESARRGTLAERTGRAMLADTENIDDDDDALAAYNRMLTSLHKREQHQR
ncbi:MAG: cytochrome c oxidase assembly protein [Sciscionella sp.]|nr:cytochrome c oxidase assembly protein [Sciscionella sp.]